jgi:hypothetical protein
MRLSEILNEYTYETGVRDTKNSWYVRNRFTHKVVKRNMSKEEAEALVAKYNAEDAEKQREFYKTNKGMMMGDVHLADYNK